MQNEKKSEFYKKIAKSSDEQIVYFPSYNYYKDLLALKQDDLQFKQNYKYRILQPYEPYEVGTKRENMRWIEATLEICTLYKGVPDGLALISYNDPKDKTVSFRGVGIFVDGQLEKCFTCVKGDGSGRLFARMAKGRPADGSYYTQFIQPFHRQYVESTK